MDPIRSASLVRIWPLLLIASVMLALGGVTAAAAHHLGLGPDDAGNPRPHRSPAASDRAADLASVEHPGVPADHDLVEDRPRRSHCRSS